MSRLFSKAVLAIFVFCALTCTLHAQAGSQSTDQSAQASESSSANQGVTPFSFIQRTNVRQEIGITEAQLDRVDKFQPICDAICQTKVQAQMEAMPTYLQNLYEDMTLEQRMNAKGRLEQDMQEETEMEALDSQILNSNQMSRFGQLWTQQAGIDGLMSGTTSRQLGITEPQKSSISQVQNIGFNAMDACQANPNLSQSQKNLQIQQIQNIAINQTINILNADQINIYVGLCGDKFDFGGPVDSDDDALADDGSTDEATDDVADADDGNSVDESSGEGSEGTGDSSESEGVGEVQVADASGQQSRAKVQGFGNRNGSTSRPPRSFGSPSSRSNAQSGGTESFGSSSSSSSQRSSGASNSGRPSAPAKASGSNSKSTSSSSDSDDQSK